MKLETGLFREPGEHSLPRDLAVPVSKTRGRPKLEYRLRVKSEADVVRLRRHGVPLALLTPELVAKNGYPLSFRPRLLVPSSLRSVVETTFPTLELRDEETVRRMSVEDLVAVMLKVRRLAARQLVRRNLDRMDPVRLAERVFVENLLGSASRVRLSEFVAGLPQTVPSMPEADLAAEDAQVYGD